MGKFTDLIKDEATTLLRNKKNLANLLILGILILGLYLGVNLARQQQIIKSRAAQDPIVFTGSNIVDLSGGKKGFKLNAEGKAVVGLELTSPLGSLAQSSTQTVQNSKGLVKTAYAASCTLSKKAPTLTDACADCIINADPAFFNEVKRYNPDCNNTEVVSHTCNYGVSGDGGEGCNSIRAYQCADVCCQAGDGGTGTLTVSPQNSAVIGDTLNFNVSKDPGDFYVDKLRNTDTNTETGGISCSSIGRMSATCTAQTAGHYQWARGLPGGCSKTTYTINPTAVSPSATATSATSLTCAISGPKSVAKNEKATYSASSSDARVRTMEIYYNYNDKSVGSDYHKVATCNADITGLSGNCKGDVDTSIIPAGTGNFVVLCNAYDYKPREDGIPANCVSGNNNPIGCRPDGKDLKANACTGNSLWTTGRDFGWSGCGNSSHQDVALTTAAVVTTDFRVAESPADFTEVGPNGWQKYTKAPMQIDSFEFKDKTPGTKNVFVQFMDSTGKKGGCGDNKSQSCQAQIRLLSPGPVITGCSLSFEGNNTVLNLTADKEKGFGPDKGKVKSGDTELGIKKWKNDSVQAIWTNSSAGEKIPVVLTNTDGQASEEIQCSATSQLSLGAKVFCRAPSSHDTDNVELVLAEAFEGGKKTKQKIKIDKDGVVQGLSQKLEAGKRYKISLKAPKSLRKTREFTAEAGTTTIPNFILPVGDIFPVDGGDGAINSSDKAELNRQWVIAGSGSGRTGDFNGDEKINSFDWACMRYDHGSVDELEPSPGGPAVSVAVPSPTSTSQAVFCGGIANIECPAGYKCQLDDYNIVSREKRGKVVDDGGHCVPVSNSESAGTSSK